MEGICSNLSLPGTLPRTVSWTDARYMCKVCAVSGLLSLKFKKDVNKFQDKSGGGDTKFEGQ